MGGPCSAGAGRAPSCGCSRSVPAGQMHVRSCPTLCPKREAGLLLRELVGSAPAPRLSCCHAVLLPHVRPLCRDPASAAGCCSYCNMDAAAGRIAVGLATLRRRLPLWLLTVAVRRVRRPETQRHRPRLVPEALSRHTMGRWSDVRLKRKIYVVRHTRLSMCLREPREPRAERAESRERGPRGRSRKQRGNRGSRKYYYRIQDGAPLVRVGAVLVVIAL